MIEQRNKNFLEYLAWESKNKKKDHRILKLNLQILENLNIFLEMNII